MNRALFFPLIFTIFPVVSYSGRVTPESSDEKTEEVVDSHTPEGTLGRLLDFVLGTGAWYPAFFGDLSPLDELALAATDHRGHAIAPYDITLVIDDDESLKRFFALDQTVALSHIQELQFAFFDDDPNDSLRRILRFLGQNGHRFTNLQGLDLEILPDRQLQDLIILRSALTDAKLRALLLQVHYVFQLRLHERPQFTEFFETLAYIEEDLDLQQRVVLEIDADNAPLHLDFFQVLRMTSWHLDDLRSLTLRGQFLNDQAIREFFALLKKGDLHGLTVLELIDSNLGANGLRLLSHGLFSGWFPKLVSFRFEDRVDGPLLTQEDALEHLTGIFRAHATLKEFAFISNTIISLPSFERFFTNVFHSFLFSFSLEHMTLVGLTDAHLEIINLMAHRFQTLRVLDLRGNKVLTLGAINALQKALPKCLILWDGELQQPLAVTLGDDADPTRAFFRY